MHKALSAHEMPGGVPPVDDVELLDDVDPPDPSALKKSHSSDSCQFFSGSESFEFSGAAPELAVLANWDSRSLAFTANVSGTTILPAHGRSMNTKIAPAKIACHKALRVNGRENIAANDLKSIAGKSA